MDSLDKKEYELGYLIKDEAVTGAGLELVRAAGADIRQEGPVNRIHLAYPVKKQTEAFFGFVQFAMEPEKAKQLENTLRMDGRILRSLLITPPPVKEKRRIGEPREAAPRTYEPREPRVMPLSNEALEKKIEEILQ